tara:strand:- start:2956 stop:3105 length:150 start_codon:yes stop_codon:yes gene_type:complete
MFMRNGFKLIPSKPKTKPKKVTEAAFLQQFFCSKKRPRVVVLKKQKKKN